MKLKKNWIIYLIVGLLLLGVVGGGIVGILKLTDTGKLDTKTISSTKFSVGGLDSNGKYMNTNTSIYTKEAFECQGLEVSLDFDNEIEYQIYFYDQNNDFVHTTGKLSGAFVKESVPFFAKYARIVVTPKEDDVVSTIEVLKYARQLTVKVNREQGFKNYTENLCFVDESVNGLNFNTGEASFDDSKEGGKVSTFVNISPYKEALMFKVNTQSNLDGIEIVCYDSSKSFLGTLNMNNCSVVFESSQSIKYYNVDLSKMVLNSKSVDYIRLYTGNGWIEIYCR